MLNIIIWFAIAFTSIFTTYFLIIGTKQIIKNEQTINLEPKNDSELKLTKDGYVLIPYSLFTEIQKLLSSQKNSINILNKNFNDVERINEKINTRINDITDIEYQNVYKSKIYNDIAKTNCN